MEILFITHKYPPGTGGMEKQSFELVSRMKAHSKVHLIAIAPKESKLVYFLILRKRIISVLTKNPNISIVHFNDGVMASIGLMVYHWKGILKTATLHGLDITFPNSIFRKFLVPRFNKLDLVICVSRFTAETSVDLGLDRQKIKVINNGIDHELANSEPNSDEIDQLKNLLGAELSNKKILLSIGRAVKRKGFSWFIKNIASKLPEEYCYVMIGPLQMRSGFHRLLYSVLPSSITSQIDLFLGWADDSQEILKYTQSPSFKKRVKHLGKIPYELLVALINQSYALVMPNINIEGDAEGFGLVALEANMKKKIVFASDLQGIRDAVHHNENGILIETENIDQWVNTISSSAITNEIEERALLFAMNRFSWDKMVSEYYQLFENLEIQKAKSPTEVLSIS